MPRPVAISLAAFGALLLAAASPSIAAAQGRSTMECNSIDDRRNHCAVPNIDPESVNLEEQLSRTNCSRNDNWGTDANGIWVSGGCRARFSYATHRGGGNRAGGSGTIECDSNEGRRNHCSVPGIDPESVNLEQQLSRTNCSRNDNWGTDANGIWVSGGCRARFSYRTHGGGGMGGGSVSMKALEQACVRHAASSWNVTEANLEVGPPRDNRDGTWQVKVSSQRTTGLCTVDSRGRVQKLETF